MQKASVRITVVLFVTPTPPHFVLYSYFLTSFFFLIAYSYLSHLRLYLLFVFLL